MYFQFERRYLWVHQMKHRGQRPLSNRRRCFFHFLSSTFSRRDSQQRSFHRVSSAWSEVIVKPRSPAPHITDPNNLKLLRVLFYCLQCVNRKLRPQISEEAVYINIYRHVHFKVSWFMHIIYSVQRRWRMKKQLILIFLFGSALSAQSSRRTRTPGPDTTEKTPWRRWCCVCPHPPPRSRREESRRSPGAF